METYAVETDKDTTTSSVAIDVGSIVAPREITVTPVPYAGSERPFTIVRPAISRFMIEKPA